jgi:hypothetical protein
MNQDSLYLFELTLKIANYTGFSRDEILSWTIDEIKHALDFINKEEQNKNKIKIALIDYQHFLHTSTKFDNKHQSEAQKCIRNATKIRNQLTGYKKPKNQNLSIFGNYRIKED